MNMRQHKRYRDAQQLALWAPVFFGRKLLAKFNAAHAVRERDMLAGPTPQVFHDLLDELLAKRVREETIQEVEEAKVEYVCKKRNGEVVAVFDLLSDATALVMKHHKQKKAKLEVMDSSTGELILFSEANEPA